MTQEEKELLLKDLCGRLLYGVRMKGVNEDFELSTSTPPERLSYVLNSADFKPYLRPMSSMTKDEEKELGNYLSTEVFLSIDGLNSVLRAQRHTSNFLYSRHFDILGLIEKGLAFEAPEDMYKN